MLLVRQVGMLSGKKGLKDTLKAFGGSRDRTWLGLLGCIESGDLVGSTPCYRNSRESRGSQRDKGMLNAETESLSGEHQRQLLSDLQYSNINCIRGPWPVIAAGTFATWLEWLY